jgi:hypothetical protein
LGHVDSSSAVQKRGMAFVESFSKIHEMLKMFFKECKMNEDWKEKVSSYLNTSLIIWRQKRQLLSQVTKRIQNRSKKHLFKKIFSCQEGVTFEIYNCLAV